MAAEEPVAPALPTETAAIVADLVVAPNEEANPVPNAEESKPTKLAAAVPRKRKSGSRTHPTYFEMIKEAIVTLNERNGSSQFAIAKFIEDNHKNLPANFRKILLIQSKKLVVSGKLVKVKSSYKLPSKAAAAAASAPSSVKKKKSAAAAKRKTKKAAVAVAKKEAANPKVVTASKPKAAAKPAAAKSTLAASKAKPVVKAKTPTLEASKVAETKPAKVQRTSTRSAPGNKPDVVVAKPAVENSPVKKLLVKSKATKSPVKKAAAKKGKK